MDLRCITEAHRDGNSLHGHPPRVGSEANSGSACEVDERLIHDSEALFVVGVRWSGVTMSPGGPQLQQQLLIPDGVHASARARASEQGPLRHLTLCCTLWRKRGHDEDKLIINFKPRRLAIAERVHKNRGEDWGLAFPDSLDFEEGEGLRAEILHRHHTAEKGDVLSQNGFASRAQTFPRRWECDGAERHSEPQASERRRHCATFIGGVTRPQAPRTSTCSVTKFVGRHLQPRGKNGTRSRTMLR